ncbi:mRNA 3 end processing protein [Cryptosporidium felis]|nr:mRNA 3 end processing protein [Cryptosporidium felis]
MLLGARQQSWHAVLGAPEFAELNKELIGAEKTDPRRKVYGHSFALSPRDEEGPAPGSGVPNPTPAAAAGGTSGSGLGAGGLCEGDPDGGDSPGSRGDSRRHLGRAGGGQLILTCPSRFRTAFECFRFGPVHPNSSWVDFYLLDDPSEREFAGGLASESGGPGSEALGPGSSASEPLKKSSGRRQAAAREEGEAAERQGPAGVGKSGEESDFEAFLLERPFDFKLSSQRRRSGRRRLRAGGGGEDGSDGGGEEGGGEGDGEDAFDSSSGVEDEEMTQVVQGGEEPLLEAQHQQHEPDTEERPDQREQRGRSEEHRGDAGLPESPGGRQGRLQALQHPPPQGSGGLRHSPSPLQRPGAARPDGPRDHSSAPSLSLHPLQGGAQAADTDADVNYAASEQIPDLRRGGLSLSPPFPGNGLGPGPSTLDMNTLKEIIRKSSPLINNPNPMMFDAGSGDDTTNTNNGNGTANGTSTFFTQCNVPNSNRFSNEPKNTGSKVQIQL